MQDSDATRNLRRLLHQGRAFLGEQADFIFVALVMGGGIAAFLWVGFASDLNSSDILRHDPWPLFLWFCVVIVLGELYVGYKPTSGVLLSVRRKGALLAFTLASVLGVIIVRFYGYNHVLNALQQLWRAISQLLQSIHIDLTVQAGFNVLNFGIIVVAAVVLFMAYRYSEVVSWSANEKPVRGEETAGYFLMLALFLPVEAAVFVPAVVRWVTGGSLGGHLIQDCDLTLLPVACKSGSMPPFVSTLYACDLALALFCALLALIIIVSGALLRALRERSPEGYVAAFLRSFWAAIARRFTLIVVIASLRLFWPVLILLATGAAVFTAVVIQWLLVALAHPATPHALSLLWSDWSPKSYALYFLRLEAFGGALGMLVAAVMAIALRKAPRIQYSFGHLLVTARRVGWMSGRLLWGSGRLVALSYWGFSFILSGINALALYIGQLFSQNWPAAFVQPDPLALLSLAFFTYSLYRYFRGPRRGARMPRRGPPVGARAPGAGVPSAGG